MTDMTALRDGSEVPAPVLLPLMASLRALSRESPIAFYELTQMARDSQHRPWGDTANRLRELGLIEPTGRLHDVTAQVVRNAVEGEGLGLRLVSPLVEPAR